MNASAIRVMFVFMSAPLAVMAGISPSRLQVNLGPLPVDGYTDINAGFYPTSWCPSTENVRNCVQSLLASYASQGVTGVRFQFGLGGGGGVARPSAIARGQ